MGASPMPREPPVMSTVFPDRSFSIMVSWAIAVPWDPLLVLSRAGSPHLSLAVELLTGAEHVRVARARKQCCRLTEGCPDIFCSHAGRYGE